MAYRSRRALSTYGKINTTLVPTDSFGTSVVFLFFHPRPSVLGGEITADLGPEEIFYRPRVVLYIAETPVSGTCIPFCIPLLKEGFDSWYQLKLQYIKI